MAALSSLVLSSAPFIPAFESLEEDGRAGYYLGYRN